MFLIVLVTLISGGITAPVRAENIANPVSVLVGLDKITGRTLTFSTKLHETVQFGALLITPRVCHTQPPTEPPDVKALLQISEVTLNKKVRPVFFGWMFAANPALNAVDHAVYDVWLKTCKTDLP